MIANCRLNVSVVLLVSIAACLVHQGQLRAQTNGACCWPRQGVTYCTLENSELDCDAIEGVWHDGETSCTGNCETSAGRCCYWLIGNPVCEVTGEGLCDFLGGDWRSGYACYEDNCNVEGKCCYFDEAGHAEACVNTTPSICTTYGESARWFPGFCATDACELGHCCFTNTDGSIGCGIFTQHTCNEVGGAWASGVLNHGTISCNSHGRCCSDGDSTYCKIETEESCLSQNDPSDPTKPVYHWSWGMDCSSDCFGHCCFLDAEGEVKCDQLLEDDCISLFGVWDEGKDCKTTECSNHGRCCNYDKVDDPTCTVTTMAECEGENENWVWLEDCDAANPCPIFGSCCFINIGEGECLLLEEEICGYLGGQWDDLLNCNEVTCQFGSCCLIENGITTCEVLFESECVLIGGNFSLGATCDPTFGDIAPCCRVDGSCALMQRQACKQAGGIFEESAWDCAAASCDPAPTGACCLPTGTCTEVDLTTCDMMVGVYSGMFTTCVTLPCPQPSFEDGTVPLFSTFGPIDSTAYSGSLESYDYWSSPDEGYRLQSKCPSSQPACGSKNVIAMPFSPTWGGFVSEIHLALTFNGTQIPFPSVEEGLSSYLQLAIVEDDNGLPKIISETSPAILNISYQNPDMDTPECEDSVRIPRSNAGAIFPSSNHTISIKLSECLAPIVELSSLQQYWLILINDLPYQNSADDFELVWANGERSLSGALLGTAAQSGPVITWEPAPDCASLAAFRIDGNGLGCGIDSVLEYEDCTSNDPSEFESRCWYGDANLGYGYLGYPETGYPLHQNMWQIGPLDYPPVSNDPVGGTSPLVSRDSGFAFGSAPHRERPTLNDTVDLISGSPLLRAVDFELPFGGASFRHIRTYAEPQDSLLLRPTLDAGTQGPNGYFWDWNGMFWMMSESPFLLIDASYSDSGGDPIVYPDSKRCYFISDAHHAVPFLFEEDAGNPGTGKYKAPSWFDGRMLTSADASLPVQHVDSEGRPEFFYVWQHRGAVKYTFKAHYEDLWIGDSYHTGIAQPDSTLSVHDPASGLGLPYYGIIQEIQDRNGNKIVYDYCGHQQWNCGPDDDPTGTGLSQYSEACTNCCQNCNEKGQIKSIRLVTAAGETAWTLIYTFREFLPSDMHYLNGSPLFAQNALHAIHVYEGDLQSPLPDGCLTIDANAFCNLESIEEIDAIEHPIIADLAAQNEHWLIRSRYVYSEYGFDWSGASCPSINLFPGANADLYSHGLISPVEIPGQPPEPQDLESLRFQLGNRLRKVTVERRKPDAGGSNESLEQSFTLYTDDTAPSFGSNVVLETGGAYLNQIFENDTIQSIIEASTGSSGTREEKVNHLLTLGKNALVEFIDPSTDTSSFCTLGGLADIKMRMRDLDLDPEESVSDYVYDHFRNLYATSPNTAFAHRNRTSRRQLFDRRSDSPTNGDYRIYQLIQLPESYGDDFEQNPEIDHNVSWSAVDFYFRFPYRYRVSQSQGGSTDRQDHNLSDVFFITVIDELRLSNAYDEETGQIKPCAEAESYNPITEEGLRSRRVVEMNAAGFILRDRTWAYEADEGGVIVSQTGFGTTLKFDCKGRIIERRSAGWDVAQSLGNDSHLVDGLIEVLQYEDPCCPIGSEPDTCDCSAACGVSTAPAGELIALGYKQGLNGTALFTDYFERGESSRPELVTRQIRFPDGVELNSLPTGPTSPVQPSWEFEETQFEFGVSDDNLDETRPVLSTTKISAAVPASEGGTPAHRVEKDYYDETGRIVWRSYGALTDPDNTATAIELYWDYSAYDERGRPTMQVIDADPTAATAHANFSSVTPPVDLLRVSTATALNLTTLQFYDSTFGLNKTIFPNGRETRINYFNDPTDPSVLVRWEQPDLVPVDDPPGEYRPLRPANVVRTNGGGHLASLMSATMDYLNSYDPDDTYAKVANEEFDLISETTPEYDGNGRVTGVKRSGGGDDISAQMTYDGFGNVAREVTPDGTITRNLYDERGRLIRRYRGTNDDHAYWANGLACPPGETPTPEFPCTPLDDFEDDLTLIEKRYYGEGVQNTYMLTEVRYYRDKPLNQYFEPPLPPETPEEPWPAGYVPPPDNNEDAIGWVEYYGYDWKSRQAVIESTDATGNILSINATWFDALDRPRLTATFGANSTLSSTWDPRLLRQSDSLPTAADLIGGGATPAGSLLSLMEYRYNSRGLIEETRDFDLSDTTGATYTSTVTYYGYHDKATETHAPSAPVRVNEYDAKRRVVRSRSYVNGIEMARTDTRYGDQENISCNCQLSADSAISSTHWERAPNATGNDLTESNSIRTFAHTWFDESGRVIATADFGTNNSTFSNTTGQMEPVYAAGNPPVVLVNDEVTAIDDTTFDAWVRVTGFAFDKEGRQKAVFHPEGSVTRYTYDKLGRTLTESLYAEANDPDGDFLQRTAYQYDEFGRNTAIAAVLPGFTGSYDSIWSATQHVQITAILYGAQVINQGDGTAISENAGFTKEVHFPHHVTGQPDPADSIKFTYYADGQVHSRTDARGVVLTHEYDELSRRTVTLINDSAPNEGVATDNLPANRAGSIHYEYEGDGLTGKVTLKNTSGEIIAENVFTHDANRNLTGDYQQHGAAVDTANSPVVNYIWDFRTATLPTGNYNRLKYIRYPQAPGASAQPPLDPRREVNLIYNSGIDSLLSRVSSITTRAAEAISPHNAALYQYTGLNRRTRVEYGNQTVLDYTVSGVLTRLDAFGRPIDHNWQQPDTSNPAQLGLRSFARYQHGYDKSGNRTFARVTQHTEDEGGANPVMHDNDRSWAYGYDKLNRLVAADFGQLNVANDAIVANSAPAGLPMTTDWLLDSVGNWSGDGTSAGRMQTVDPDGAGPLPIENVPFSHNTLVNNELESITEGSTTTTLIHDVCGNLVADDNYVYLYDGLNRLVEIRPYDPVNDIISNECEISGSTILDPPVTTFRYDGLGRLIEIERPVPNTTAVAVWHLYYDGVRRIQEVKQYIAGPIGFETQCEYVYGAGYVDEFILAANPNDDVHYLHQDANYNLIAQTDENGAVMYQSSYSPYGELLAFEQIETDPLTNKLPRLGIGHQGLFHINNEGGGTGAPTTANDTGRYYNRNRWYDAAVGRFTQRDPNWTGALTSHMAYAGDSPQPQESPLFSINVYNDGLNLYGTLLSNPLSGTDALGLARHHFYPIYLGGHPKGPGIELDDASHSAFHRSLSESLGGSTWKSQRERWRDLTPELRKTHLMEAAEAAGLDVTDPSFSALLEESYGNATHGKKMKRRGIPNRNMRTVPSAPKSGAKGAVFGKLKGANRLRVLKYGGAVASAALSVATLAALDIWDPNIQQLGIAGHRARANGGLTIWDEAFALGDFYNLTQEPVSAGHAWRDWQRGIDN